MSNDHIHDPDHRQEPAETESKEAAHGSSAGDAAMASTDDMAPTATDDVATASDGQLGRTPGWGRRELFRALASVPVFGALAYGVWSKRSTAEERRRKIFEELGVTGDAPAVIPQAISNPPSGSCDSAWSATVAVGRRMCVAPASRRPNGPIVRPRPRRAIHATRRSKRGWRNTICTLSSPRCATFSTSTPSAASMPRQRHPTGRPRAEAGDPLPDLRRVA